MAQIKEASVKDSLKLGVSANAKVKIRRLQVTPSGRGRWLRAKGEGGPGIECGRREQSSRDSNVSVICQLASLSSTWDICYRVNMLRACCVHEHSLSTCCTAGILCSQSPLCRGENKDGFPVQKVRALGDLEGPPLAMFSLEALNLTTFTLYNRKWKYIYPSLFTWEEGCFLPLFFSFQITD